jgi:hypothetical protein
MPATRTSRMFAIVSVSIIVAWPSGSKFETLRPRASAAASMSEYGIGDSSP